MILNCVSLFLIFLVAAYLGNQGVLSALLALITATFASILAAGYFEPLQGLIAGWRPDYARGITFLLLFFLAFSACRIAADMLILKNLRLPRLIDRAIGGVVGLFAGLVIIGSTLIGIQMLPLGTNLLGYDRFGGENGMQVYEDQGNGKAAVWNGLAAGSNIWLMPDNFTVGIWNLALGKALGGNQSFTSVHPNFLVESYGYRQTVQPGVAATLPPDLFSVPSAWVSNDPAYLSMLKITDTDKALVLVRTEVKQGGDPPKVSANMGTTGNDAKPYFFVTPTEVRLVTDKPRQYYPIGYLEKGRTFIATAYDTGQVADDFPKDKDKVVQDWLFEISADEKPQFIEVKQLARVPLAGVIQVKPFGATNSDAYAPRTSRADQSTVVVHVSDVEGVKLDGIKVYVLQPMVPFRDAKSLIVSAYDENLAHLKDIDSSGTWTKAQGQPGVPGSGQMNSTWRILQGMESKDYTDNIPLHDILPNLLIGQSTPDGPRNLVVLSKYFDEKIVPLISPNVIKDGITDTGGSVELPEIPKGTYDIVALAKGDKTLYLWARQIQLEAKSSQNVELSGTRADFSVIIK